MIKQLDAEPLLTREQLRDLVRQVLGPEDEEPHVFRLPELWTPSEASPVVWAVVYRDDTYGGFLGSRITVDSFAVDRGRARFAERGGSEMSGYAMKVFEMRNPSPDKIAVLIQGILGWSSGHSLPAKVVLYGISRSGIEILWESKTLPGLEASVSKDRTQFSVQYHDETAHQAKNPLDSVIDTYALGTSAVIKISTERR